MWDFISHSARAKRNRAIEQKKKEAAAKLISSFHLKRVPAQIRISGGLGGVTQVVQARIVSTDLAEKRVRIFTPVELPEGLEVSITFADPQQFYIKGKVRWSREHNLHRTVMSSVNYPYRSEISFVMETEAERERVREFAHNFARRFIANEEPTDAPAPAAATARGMPKPATTSQRVEMPQTEITPENVAELAARRPAKIA
ncbi:MAG: hypothetical protein AB7P04_12720 [Bacteriovoracia bacterium]